MSAGSSTVGGSAEMGKGIFGYRKSDVQQLLADRDTMLRTAEKRIRASETRIAELEKMVAEANERKVRMEEQVRRLRQELDSVAERRDHGERVADEVRAEAERVADEADRMASWKRSLQDIAAAMVPTVERFRAAASELPSRMEQSFSPLSDRIASLASLIEEFGRVSGQSQNRSG